MEVNSPQRSSGSLSKYKSKSPIKRMFPARIMDSDDLDEQQPSRTVNPAAPKHYEGRLRDSKIVGEVSNEWSSDESDEVPTLGRQLYY